VSEELTYKYELALSNFDLSQLPADSRNPGTAEFREAISRCIQKQWQKLGGKTQIIVDDTKATVTWTTTQMPDLLSAAISYLKNKDYATGITVLEFALSREPANIDILYNLAMALSDKNELDRAIELLEQALDLDPNFAGAKIALGVALARRGEDEKALQILTEVVAVEPYNFYARKNLGACLLRLEKFSDALLHLKKATELNPSEQSAWYGLGQAYESSGDKSSADSAYKKTIALDEYSDIAELAQKRRVAIAAEAFRKKTPGLRPDAVMYCLAALQRFSKMSQEEVKKISYEIAMLGTKGLSVNNPDSKYTLKSMAGTFSGLQLVSYMYVGFKQIAPQMDVGFDLKNEYEAAKSMMENQE
jgi:tetratricopeptide (TPR) repeat protein